MRILLASFAIAAAVLPVQGAIACAPPPPGYVQPTIEQILERSLTGASDIVYGVITHSGASGEPSRLKVLHVYLGDREVGDTIEAMPGLGHPEPFCGGMMGPPRARPVGAYGVVVLKGERPQLNFVTPEHVQIMIREGWIKSAQAR